MKGSLVEGLERQAKNTDIGCYGKMDKLFAWQLPEDLICKDALLILWEVIETPGSCDTDTRHFQRRSASEIPQTEYPVTRA